MKNQTTKILIGIFLGLSAVLLLFGVYKYFSNSTTSQSETQNPENSSFPSSENITPSDSSRTIIPLIDNKNQATQQSSTGGSTQGNIPNLLNIKIVSDKPTANGFFISKTSSTATTQKVLSARYIEQDSGHISELDYNKNLPTTLSNTTITRIHDAIFDATNKNLLIRRLDDNNNPQYIYATLLPPTSATSSATSTTDSIGKLSQSLLSSNIKEFAVSPSKDKIFFLTYISGDYVGTTENFGSKTNGSNKKQIFSSPIGEWQIQWPQDNIIFFNTKPSANIPGYLYSQTLTKTGLIKVLSGINGLTSNVSPDNKKLIYSVSANSAFKTYLFDLATKQISVLPVVTLPEKCIWGGIELDQLYCAVPSILPTADYPAGWYQGLISFSDELWRIDTKSGNTDLLVDKATLSKTGNGVDATNLILSPNEDYLLFTNKKDSSLWQVKIK